MFIVGIAGVTNGGKTTLCDRLLKAFPHASCINMDNYFVHWESEKLHVIEELHHANWDEIDAIDFEKLHQDVNAWIETQQIRSPPDLPPLLLIEGILIFNYKPLVPYFHKKYFLTLKKETCANRRKTRKYFPPDPENYFEKVAWPMYEKNLKAIKDQTDIVFIDGEQSRDEIYERVYSEILALTESSSNS